MQLRDQRRYKQDDWNVWSQFGELVGDTARLVAKAPHRVMPAAAREIASGATAIPFLFGRSPWP
jgi:hypothetical protein